MFPTLVSIQGQLLAPRRLEVGVSKTDAKRVGIVGHVNQIRDVRLTITDSITSIEAYTLLVLTIIDVTLRRERHIVACVLYIFTAIIVVSLLVSTTRQT